MKMKHVLVTGFIAFTSFTSFQLYGKSAGIIPVNLKCEFESKPAGIDVEKPQLGWNLEALSPGLRNKRQTAYRVQVASSLQILHSGKPDIWDSGRVSSDRMNEINFEGKPLKSTSKYYWRVRIWDEQGKSSPWSEPEYWLTGILSPQDLAARWISARGAEKYALQYASARKDYDIARDYPEHAQNRPVAGDPNFSSLCLRQKFPVKPTVRQAIVHVSGLGQYELRLNGRKVGDYLLAPGWSDYKKTVLYDTYEVTEYLKEGTNVLGILVGNGMYNIQPDTLRYVKFLNTFGPLKAILQLQIEYTDGSVETVVTDENWQVAPGPITYSNLFGGEDYDARLSEEWWDQSGFIPGNLWESALVCDGPGGELKGLSCSAPPIKSIEILEPVSINQINPALAVYDFGQNASIITEIKVRGPAGSRIRMIPSELIHPDGTVDRSSATQNGVRPAWWEYTKATDREESHMFQFFYQGARYVQVELFPVPGGEQLPGVEQLTAHVVHTSAQPTGNFSCSNPLFNRIYPLVRWAQRSNLMSIITDCPQREKLGWLEQYHLNGPSLRYNYDLTTLFRKGMNDMADSQLDYGFVPNIAPEFFMATPHENHESGFRNSPEWGSSFIIVPWQQYLFSGDITLIKRYYDRMKKYIGFLDDIAQDHIIHYGLGDWYDMGPNEPWGSQLTPVPLTATAIYYYDCRIMAQMAELTGNAADTGYYREKAETIRRAFNKEFFHEESKTYATNSQTANAMPLFLEIVEPPYRKKVAEAIVKDIRDRDNAMTSGDVGYRFLLKALAMEGYSHVIYDMNNQSDRPGYGYQLKMGATSLTEKWNAGAGYMGSQNHFMLGQINEWFFHDLSGIQPDIEGPGFRRIILRPAIAGDLTWVKGSYRSISGPIRSEWKLEEGKFKWLVAVPPNTHATIYIPCVKGGKVYESGQPLNKGQGIRENGYKTDYLECVIGSGEYFFESEYVK